jgi:hypothetical protein
MAKVPQELIPVWRIYDFLQSVHVDTVNHRHRDAMLKHPKVVNSFWDSKKESCQWICDNCEDCVLATKYQPSKVINKPSYPEYPMQRVQIDATSLREDNNGNRGQFVATDLFSKKCYAEGTFEFFDFISRSVHSPLYDLIFLFRSLRKQGRFRPVVPG